MISASALVLRRALIFAGLSTAALGQQQPTDWRVNLFGAQTNAASLENRPEELEVERLGFGLAYTHRLEQGKFLTVTANSEVQGYEWGNLGGVTTSFDKHTRYHAVGLNYIRASKSSTLVCLGKVTSGSEGGVSLGDSLIFRLGLGMKFRLSKTLSIGPGLAYTSSLEDEGAFTPIPFVRWDFAQDWSLRTAESHLVGLALAYQLNPTLELDLTVGSDISEFRLSDSRTGTYSAGAVRDRATRISLGASWAPTPSTTVSLGVGTFANREFELFDQNGEQEVLIKYDEASFALLGLEYRF